MFSAASSLASLMKAQVLITMMSATSGAGASVNLPALRYPARIWESTRFFAQPKLMKPTETDIAFFLHVLRQYTPDGPEIKG